MSGTASGTIILHVSPESAVGGPLAWVQTGDRIRLSLNRRELSWLVDEQTLARRMKEKPLQPVCAQRGYRQLFLREVLQAEMGVDFDFLRRHPHPVKIS
jgi:dihydroxy-acid dehydratase